MGGRHHDACGRQCPVLAHLWGGSAPCGCCRRGLRAQQLAVFCREGPRADRERFSTQGSLAVEQAIAQWIIGYVLLPWSNGITTPKHDRHRHRKPMHIHPFSARDRCAKFYISHLQMPPKLKKLNWNSGYNNGKGELFIFCGAGAPDGTAHDYGNHFPGYDLVWLGETRSYFGQNSIRLWLPPQNISTSFIT